MNKKLSQKSKDRIKMIHEACLSKDGSATSEVIECNASPRIDDSGYSSDVDAFESPLSPVRSENTGVSLEEYKMQIDEAIREFFITGDFMELSYCVDELDAPILAYELVMRCISLALDREDREREMISRFFAVASGNQVTVFAMTKGFEKLFQRISDYQLDCPNVKEYFGRFLARAIGDEVVPPIILQNVIMNECGADVIHIASVFLGMPHSLERLEHIWGTAALTLGEVEGLKKAIRIAIEEYYDSHDTQECLCCLKELDSLYFMHEAIKRIVEIAMDGDDKRQLLAKTLIKEGYEQDVFSQHQIMLGMKRIMKGLDELLLDVPYAQQYLNEMKQYLVDQNILVAEDLS